MIKFEKQLIEDYEDLVDGGLSGCLKTPADLVKYVKNLLLRQIDEDNKRFLGKLKAWHNKRDHIFECAAQDEGLECCVDKFIEEQVELRDKVNKNGNKRKS